MMLTKCHPEGEARRISDGDSSHFVLGMTLCQRPVSHRRVIAKGNAHVQDISKKIVKEKTYAIDGIYGDGGGDPGSVSQT